MRRMATYPHGVPANHALRLPILENDGQHRRAAWWDPEAHVDTPARQAAMCLDIGRIREIAGI